MMDSGKPTRNRWNNERRKFEHPKLYDDRADSKPEKESGAASSSRHEPRDSRDSRDNRDTRDNRPDREDRDDKEQNGKYYRASSRYNKSELLDISSKTSQINQQVPDMRISKLLRRLCSETSSTGIVDLCDKLKNVVVDPVNTSYIRRSFEILANDIISVMENCPKDSMKHVCEVFGMMGYVIRNDFQVCFKKSIINLINLKICVSFRFTNPGSAKPTKATRFFVCQ